MSAAPSTLDELMAQALTMEREAVARYTELAEMAQAGHRVAQAARPRRQPRAEQPPGAAKPLRVKRAISTRSNTK